MSICYSNEGNHWLFSSFIFLKFLIYFELNCNSQLNAFKVEPFGIGSFGNKKKFDDPIQPSQLMPTWNRQQKIQSKAETVSALKSQRKLLRATRISICNRFFSNFEIPMKTQVNANLRRFYIKIFCCSIVVSAKWQIQIRLFPSRYLALSLTNLFWSILSHKGFYQI